MLTLFNVYLCCQTTEEDLNLDSEPTVEDTVEEVIIHVLLQPDCLGRRWGGGRNGSLKLIARGDYFSEIYVCKHTPTQTHICTHVCYVSMRVHKFPSKGMHET